jgi:hypothetical protein
MELTWLYALCLQAAAVIALVYVVALMGARTFRATQSARK